MINLNLGKTRHLIPAFSVQLLDGVDITQKLEKRLMSLSIEDNRGFVADTVEIVLSDHDGKLALPKTGEKLKIAIGFKGSPLTNKGVYVIDEVSWSGSPDTLTIRGKSADLMGKISSGKERSFHKKTILEIVKTIAEDCELFCQVSDDLRNIIIPHIDQSGESTINFLTRLAGEYDAIATVKNNVLLFISAGKATTASGEPLPQVVIKRNSGDGFSFTIVESGNYDCVEAYYYLVDSGERGKVEKRRTNSKGLQSQSNKTRTLRHTYKSKQAAENACLRKLNQVERGRATFSLNLAVGMAEVFPEIPVKLSGFKAEIDDENWIITKASHKISENGFVTSLELELLNKD